MMQVESLNEANIFRIDSAAIDDGAASPVDSVLIHRLIANTVDSLTRSCPPDEMAILPQASQQDLPPQVVKSQG